MAENDGAIAIEYGMIAALIAVVVIDTFQVVKTSWSAKFTAIAGNLN